MGRLIGTNFGRTDKLPSDYPPNWGAISNAFRVKCKYLCAVCGVDCSQHTRLLDVHHKNSVRGDCREINLLCLCKFHHSREPMHNHYKVKPRDMELLHQLWEEQDIPVEKRAPKNFFK